jgi:hypothetical protein
MARFDRFRMSAIRSLLGANRTSGESQNGANDPERTCRATGLIDRHHQKPCLNPIDTPVLLGVASRRLHSILNVMARCPSTLAGESGGELRRVKVVVRIERIAS